MADPEEIASAVLRRVLERRRDAPTLLVTTGGTEEPLDPVRCLSNRSSGRMGFAIAEAARDRGYRVTVLAARTSVAPPFGVEVIRVGSARELARELKARHRAHDLLVMAAAVADYRPEQTQARKIGRGKPRWSLPLVRTEDLLESIAGEREHAVTVGFAHPIGGSKTEQRRAAREKRARKHLDLIVLNDPSRAGSEFGSARNEVTLIDETGETTLPLMEKMAIAQRILDLAETLLAGRRSAGSRAPVRRPKR
jgi:phosphopantothenoylcysteine decarboxylase/phosphopantothenate--cysteine ligase